MKINQSILPVNISLYPLKEKQITWYIFIVTIKLFMRT